MKVKHTLMILIALLAGTHHSLSASALLEDKGHKVKWAADRQKHMMWSIGCYHWPGKTPALLQVVEHEWKITFS